MRIGVVASLFAVVALGVIFLYADRPDNLSPKKLPLLGEAPRFELIDQSSSPFSSLNLTGKVWVANFFFSSCHGPCPATMASLAQIVKEFEGEKLVRFVSISSDPETDTPQKLAEYAANYPSQNWSYLTGPRDQIIDASVKGFKLALTPDPNVHSTKLVLVDKEQQIRGYFSPSEPADVEQLQSAIRGMLTASRPD